MPHPEDYNLPVLIKYRRPNNTGTIIDDENTNCAIVHMPINFTLMPIFKQNFREALGVGARD